MGTTFKNQISICIFLQLLFLHIFPVFSQAASSDRILQGQSLVDGQVIISAGENFAVGFFSSGDSTNRYVGIWYNKIPVQTVIWVANRDKPISGTAGVLRIGDDGNLMVFDGNTSIWSTNTSSATANSTAVLADSGNLILLRSENVGDQSKALWESFRYPTDTYLPDMRVYTNVITGIGSAFTSWRSNDDPTSGNYSISLDPRASPQLVVWDGPKRHWRSGHWNGLIFTGLPRMTALILYGFKLTNEGNGNIYFTYTLVNSSIITRFKLRWDGTIDQFVWDEGLRQWKILLSEPSNNSEIYNNCGMFGVSKAMGSPTCSCLEGFKPKYASQWEEGRYSDGCIRMTPLQCNINGTNDVFREVRGLKWPDFADTAAANDINKCKDLCAKNCTCNAYTFASGIGCMIWSGNFVDLEHFDEGGNSLYVRLAKSELGSRKKISYVLWIVIATAITVVVGIIILILWRFNGKLLGITKADRKNDEVIHDMSSTVRGFSAVFSEADDIAIDGKHGSVPQLPLFSFNDIEIATNDFANKNKLGEGGFGLVYKGTLPGGVEVAVKRLSKWSGQGSGEFKTELTLIAKLQHRNLVRLLGCCIEGEEKLLIYEFMPNKSLDSFLFDSFKKSQLDWTTRFAIIGGIARGLLYLHRDSRLRIIHRDLKASNILLDEEMNPKISDFGMARIFGGNQNEANTVRVVGTYGYMSPEYAMEGLFSVKSDVYSFGVLLLELVSGLRNSSFHSPECSNLIRHAWSLWKDNKAAELIDPSIAGSCSEDEALRCINVAILCIQSAAADRPTMSSVVTMLESVNTKISMPGQVDICFASSKSLDFIMECHENSSSIEVPITEVTGR
ncbi:Receptor-like serine/threonine-protein kinase [Heracleum sosnowskyi]|uniref:Receptor-like serine/threonine-protein kinase n=1 Tax=Heracleum sosnowskyi TaxID=360622 RepID=A0AAD8HEL5_9APIA|nr:Receptor-like serine/threonine-protein kinase [Heracleum sosnowskyi]